MSGIPETDVELLRCAPLVDITLFPDAQANRIAQDFGRCLPFIYIFIYLWVNKRKYLEIYIIFF